MTVQILAESGLSECGRYPDLPACQEFNDFFTVLFVAVFVLPLLLVVTVAWMGTALGAAKSIQRTDLADRDKRRWTRIVWLLPLVGSLLWAGRRPATGAGVAP